MNSVFRSLVSWKLTWDRQCVNKERHLEIKNFSSSIRTIKDVSIVSAVSKEIKILALTHPEISRLRIYMNSWSMRVDLGDVFTLRDLEVFEYYSQKAYHWTLFDSIQLQSTRIKVLKIDNCMITLQFLEHVLGTQKGLNTLQMSRCRLTEQHMECIGAATVPLEHLDLQRNEGKI